MEIRRDEVTIEGLGQVIVSTSDLDYLVYDALCPETALFWVEPSEYSNVAGIVCNASVEAYLSWPLAIQGHIAWVADPARIAKAIHEERKDRT